MNITGSRIHLTNGGLHRATEFCGSTASGHPLDSPLWSISDGMKPNQYRWFELIGDTLDIDCAAEKIKHRLDEEERLWQ